MRRESGGGRLPSANEGRCGERSRWGDREGRRERGDESTVAAVDERREWWQEGGGSRREERMAKRERGKERLFRNTCVKKRIRKEYEQRKAWHVSRRIHVDAPHNC